MGDPGFVATFNRVAERYDRRYGRACAAAHDLVLDRIGARDRISTPDRAGAGGPAPRSVLDIGCGTGQLLAEAARLWPGAELVGVDPAARMIDVARRRLPQARLLVGRAERLPLEPASVDLVLSTTSFGHWADQAAGLREVARVLRSGGRCVIVEHAPPPALVALAYRLVNRLPQLRDAAGLAALARDAGFPRAEANTLGGFVVATLPRDREESPWTPGS